MADRLVSLDLAADVERADIDRTGVRSQAEGGIVAQLCLQHSDLVLRPSLRRAPAITIEPDYWTAGDAGRTVLFFTAYGPEFDGFETALEIDPTVTDPVLVDRYPDRRIYRVALTDRAITLVEATAAVGGRLRGCSSSRDGWQFQLRFPSRDALVAFNTRCRELDVSVTVEHLRLADEECEGVVSLTAKQQELLAVAYEEGYFDVPRRISQDELADRLDVSKSAISQRLRRAIAELCASTFS
ncbi:bacterio-opsin activator [Natronococcus pandeyae]|uniref:Bacterio-opsin activator n=1 Tax=Natronococcus pandeyae TaxID=2055836 RepID=A0A8J8TPA1_9EURY|nr:helix-turn-helix domain-containing protein [Natronococcus pandeyae]TYL37551.1 bacterio-opsin activator [Natronococcus pandeyae]